MIPDTAGICASSPANWIWRWQCSTLQMSSWFCYWLTYGHLSGRPEHNQYLSNSGSVVLDLVLIPLSQGLICYYAEEQGPSTGLCMKTRGLCCYEGAAAIVPPTTPRRLIGAVPCKIGAPVTSFVLAQWSHQTGCKFAEYCRLRKQRDIKHADQQPQMHLSGRANAA